MTNSRSKGKRGELEVAEMLRRYGFQAARGQQFRGSPDSPDVRHDIPGVAIEVKRTERFQLYAALEQAGEDAKAGDIPTVFHRMNGRPWVVVLSADHFLLIMQTLHKASVPTNG